LYAVTKQLASQKFGSSYILLRPPGDQGLCAKLYSTRCAFWFSGNGASENQRNTLRDYGWEKEVLDECF
jgi:hypothetical protein